MSRKAIPKSSLPDVQRQVQLPGDYKPVEDSDPAADVLARVYALILSWPVAEAGDPDLDETKGAAH